MFGDPRLEAPVLIVDDCDDARETLAILLQEEGYCVATAPDGRRAMEYLKSGTRPGLILLDLRLPVMDGWEFCARQQQDPALASIPVVLLTSLDEEDRCAHPASAAACIAKPLSIDHLFAVVQRHWAVSGTMAGTA